VTFDRECDEESSLNGNQSSEAGGKSKKDFKNSDGRLF